MDINSIVKKDFVMVDADQMLSSVIGKLINLGHRSAVIMRKDKYIGVLDKKKLFATGIDPSMTKVDSFATKVELMSSESNLLNVIKQLFESNCDILPVGEGKKIIGVVDGLSAVQLGLQLKEASQVGFKSVKLLKSNKIGKDDHISAAIEMMYETGADNLPVFDKSSIFGVLSIHDLLKKYLVWTPNRETSKKFTKEMNAGVVTPNRMKFGSLPVQSFSTNENYVTILDKVSLKDALNVMQTKNVTSLVVMDGNDFAGLFTLRELLRKFSELNKQSNYTVQYIGLSKVVLTENQIKMMQKAVENESEKLQNKIEGTFLVIVQLKEIGKDATKKEYAVNVKVEYPGKVLSSTHEDWDLETAVHRCFNFNPGKREERFRTLNEQKGLNKERKGYRKK